MPKHYRNGGSTISRSFKCHAWQQERDKAPKLPDKSSPAAERGSALHLPMESIVVGDTQPADYLGRVIKEHGAYKITADDVEQLEIAQKLANDLLDKYEIEELLTEPLVEFDKDTGGSIDVLGRGKTYTIIIDWKFGRVPVDARYQLGFYGMCAEATKHTADMMDGRILVLVTIQPALDDPATVHVIQDSEFTEMKAEIQAAIEHTRQPNLTPTPGDHCLYCPAAPWCTAKREQVTKFLTLSTEHADQLSAAMGLVAAMKQHIKDVEGTTINALENAEAVPGWKLVEKQRRRYWIDEGVIEDVLRSKRVRVRDFTDSKLKSVAQVEKTLKKLKLDIDLEAHTDKRSSGTTLAPMADKRPAVPGKNHTPIELQKMLDNARASV